MRVLFLLSSTEKAGAQIQVHAIVNALDRFRYQSIVGHVDPRGREFSCEFHKLGIRLVDFHAGRLRNPVATTGTVLRIARFIKKERMDILVTTGPHNDIYAALAKRLVPIPIVSYVVDVHQKRRMQNLPIVQLALALGADYYVAISKSCLEPLNGLLPSHVPREVVYLGVDQGFLDANYDPGLVRQRLGLTHQQKLVSMIGRLQHWKGQDIFLRAAERVSRACPEAYFAVVGGCLFGMEKSYAKTLEQLKDKLGLARICSLVGHQQEVGNWIAASDVVVHASRTPEPGGYVVLESMGLGKPVIASASGFPAELIEDGENGLLFPPEDENALANRIIRLLQNPALAQSLGKAAAVRIRTSFTAERMATHLAKILEKVLSIRSKPPA